MNERGLERRLVVLERKLVEHAQSVNALQELYEELARDKHEMAKRAEELESRLFKFAEVDGAGEMWKRLNERVLELENPRSWFRWWK